MTTRTIHFTPTASDRQDRIDRWLAGAVAGLAESAGQDSDDSRDDGDDGDDGDAALGGLTRSQIKRLIIGGHLTCDGVALTDPASQTQPEANYALTLPLPQPPTLTAEAIPLDILFEDTHLLVINKPAGMVVHPAPGNTSGTLVNALLHHCGEELLQVGASGRPGIVHRLDKDTSGVMVVAKSQTAQHKLGKQFAHHDLTRQYTALVWRLVTTKQFTIDAPIARNPHQRKKMAVIDDNHKSKNPNKNIGREAITHVALLRYLPPWASLVCCTLETGRTHQIRVHLTHAKHSVVGDPLYGRPPKPSPKLADADKASRDYTALRQFPRQALHAAHLGFHHPITKHALEFDVPLPADMADLLTQLTPDNTSRGEKMGIP